MPRGVYDRSKTKSQRETEKKTATTAAAPKGRRGRKPGSTNKTASTASVGTASTSQASTRQSGGSFEAFNEVRQNLVTLQSLANHFPSPQLTAEVAANVEIMKALREEYFPQKTASSTETVVQQTAPQETTQNGISSIPSTVPPLPPAPVIPPMTHS